MKYKKVSNNENAIEIDGKHDNGLLKEEVKL
jgi:hypothetical protein